MKVMAVHNLEDVEKAITSGALPGCDLSTPEGLAFSQSLRELGIRQASVVECADAGLFAKEAKGAPHAQ